MTFVDDYAHLPTEVRAALATARTGGWSRVVAVFQPHRFSRTAALAPEFGTAFADADVLVVTDVYSAGEPPSRASRVAWWPTPSGPRTRAGPSATPRPGRCSAGRAGRAAARRPLPHPEPAT